MTKKNGLGEMAKGLDWIGTKKASKEATPPIPEPSQEKNEQIKPTSIENEPAEYKDILEKYQRCTDEIRALQVPLLEMSLTCKSKPIKKLKKMKSSTLGLQTGFTRTTLIVREEYLERFKQMSHDHDASVKDILDLAITRFFKSL